MKQVLDSLGFQFETIGGAVVWKLSLAGLPVGPLPIFVIGSAATFPGLEQFAYGWRTRWDRMAHRARPSIRASETVFSVARNTGSGGERERQRGSMPRFASGQMGM